MVSVWDYKIIAVIGSRNSMTKIIIIIGATLIRSKAITATAWWVECNRIANRWVFLWLSRSLRLFLIRYIGEIQWCVHRRCLLAVVVCRLLVIVGEIQLPLMLAQLLDCSFTLFSSPRQSRVSTIVVIVAV